jgi:predicted Zn-dependent protease
MPPRGVGIVSPNRVCLVTVTALVILGAQIAAVAAPAAPAAPLLTASGVALATPPAAAPAVKDPAADPIFQAMRDELARSSKELVMPGMSAPYFLSYRVRDEESVNIDARYTALVDSTRSRSRQLCIDLRVGGPSRDNSNFYQDWSDIWGDEMGLVDEDSYAAVRHQLWYQTDGVYKKALESLARKQAYLQAHPPKKVLDDFWKAPAFVSIGQPAAVSPAIVQAAGPCVRAAATALREFPALQDWRVACHLRATTQRYVDSGGNEHRKGFPRVYYEMSATQQAADGQRLTGFVTQVIRQDDPLPPPAALAEEARGMARDLQAMASAAPLEEYVGPVLFTDLASAQFISGLFASQLGLPREALATEQWMSSQLPLGKLAARVKRRILPTFVNIHDQPRLEAWDGRRLAGTMTVDDQGVECQDISLVESGRLVGLPLSRQPVEGFTGSNGHARGLRQQRTVPAITNLVVSATETKPYSELVRELQRLCREQALEYGLLVRRLEEERYTDLYRRVDRQDDEEPLLNAPLVVYKVYAKDGRLEPVRGLGFDEVTVRALRDIVALGKDTRAYNLQQPYPGTGMYYPASIVIPSILVEEMELKSVAVQEPLAVGSNPIFD